jgi:hypothetical protein
MNLSMARLRTDGFQPAFWNRGEMDHIVLKSFADRPLQQKVAKVGSFLLLFSLLDLLVVFLKESEHGKVTNRWFSTSLLESWRNGSNYVEILCRSAAITNSGHSFELQQFDIFHVCMHIDVTVDSNKVGCPHVTISEHVPAIARTSNSSMPFSKAVSPKRFWAQNPKADTIHVSRKLQRDTEGNETNVQGTYAQTNARDSNERIGTYQTRQVGVFPCRKHHVGQRARRRHSRAKKEEEKKRH